MNYKIKKIFSKIIIVISVFFVSTTTVEASSKSQSKKIGGKMTNYEKVQKLIPNYSKAKTVDELEIKFNYTVKETFQYLNNKKVKYYEVSRQEFDKQGNLILNERAVSLDSLGKKPNLPSGNLKKKAKLITLETGERAVAIEYYYPDSEKIGTLELYKLFDDLSNKYLDKNDIKGFYLSYGFENIENFKTNETRNYQKNGQLKDVWYISVELGLKSVYTMDYYENGKMQKITYSEDGAPIIQEVYYENGQLSSVSFYGANERIFKDYYENGKLKKETLQYIYKKEVDKENKPTRIIRSYHENGKLEYELYEYKDDKKNTEKFLNEDGTTMKNPKWDVKLQRYIDTK